jgi:lipopolysaccharide export system permease protein
MKILDRYITIEFGRYLCFLSATFIALFLIIDFFQKIRMFLSNHATFQQMASHFLYLIPMILAQTLPAAVLLASLMTVGYLSRHSEIVAMKANGISLYRVAVPILGLSLLVCLLVFVLNEWITPHTTERAEYIRLVEVQKKKSVGNFKQDQIWYRGQKGIYNFKMIEPGTGALRGITLYYLDREMNLTLRIDADKGEWSKDHWVFHNVLVTRFEADGFPALTMVDEAPVYIPEGPSDFMVMQKDVDSMGYMELKRYIAKLRSEGYDATRYVVDLQGKIAFSFVSIILAVIGISFSLRSERSGGVAQGIGAGLVIGFSYWLVYAFGMSLGRSGTLPPIAAAWLANVLLGTASVWLLLRVKS